MSTNDPNERRLLGTCKAAELALCKYLAMFPSFSQPMGSLTKTNRT